MMKYILTFALALAFSTHLFAQNYKTAIGVRLGTERGITLQQYVGRKITLEGIFTTPNNSTSYNFSILAERHMNFLTRRFNLFVGVGPQIGFPKNEKLFLHNNFGVNAIGGLEASLGRLNCAIDCKPLITIDNGISNSLVYLQYGFSVRYILVKKDSVWKRMRKKIDRKTKIN